jgi:catechol 2,3-dioxygenase-like lactoylglutathione lyase family enzyme
MTTRTSLQVSGIDHVVLHVRDLDRSKAFYVDFLGMQVAWEHGRNSFLSCGSQRIALFETSEGADIHAGAEMNHMALPLADGEYAEVKETLEAAGFKVDGRPGDPHCIYLDDPDGHRLQLITPAEQQRQR